MTLSASQPAQLHHRLLRAPTTVFARNVVEFWASLSDARRSSRATIDWAAQAGFAADRLGFAFACGYQAALHALVQRLQPEELASLCATEQGGNHPRSIETRLSDTGGVLVVSGSKRFSTMAPVSDVLLVFAVAGVHEDGRRDLRLIAVPRDAPGVIVTPIEAAPFVPEVPHALVELQQVRVDPSQVLSGDGYFDYVKPFRTGEDLHVHTAVLGYLLSVAHRFSWPESIREELVALLIASQALATLDSRAAETHVVLAGWLTASVRLLTASEAYWQQVEAAERERWYRDRALIRVAGNAREARRLRAWQLLANEQDENEAFDSA